jgi:hypothetical protein
MEGEAGQWRDLPPARNKQPGPHGVITVRTRRDEET